MTSSYLQFDASDPHLNYSSGWFQYANLPDAYNGTVSVTAVQGATVRIPFYAAQIVIVGETVAPATVDEDAEGPLSLYVLDGAKNTGTIYQANVTNATSVTFYNSGKLNLTEHTLDISVLSASHDNPFYFDYFALSQPQDVPTAATAWVTTSFVTPSSTPTSSIPTSNNVSSDVSQSHSLPIGPIVGGVVGGVALLVAALLAFYFFYWRKRHDKYYSFSAAALFDADEKEHLTQTTPHIEPFIAPSSSSQYSDTPSGLDQYSDAPPRVSELGTSTPHSYPPSGSGPSQGSRRALALANPTVAPAVATLAPAQRKAQEAYRASHPDRSSSVQYHADSGQRFDSEGRPAIVASGSSGVQAQDAEKEEEVLGDVPPEYSER